LRKTTILSTIVIISIGMSVVPVVAQQTTVQRGQSIEVGQAYWINNCVSILKKITGIFPSGLPAGLTVSLARQDVTTSQCGNVVPGAKVIAKASKNMVPGTYNFSYIVTYDTQSGDMSSSHNRSITVQ
jgi:hypothetical protein